MIPTLFSKRHFKKNHLHAAVASSPANLLWPFPVAVGGKVGASYGWVVCWRETEAWLVVGGCLTSDVGQFLRFVSVLVDLNQRPDEARPLVSLRHADLLPKGKGVSQNTRLVGV